MTSDRDIAVEHSSALLARSAFVLALAAALAALVPLPFLLGAPMRSASRVFMLAGYGVMMAIWAAVLGGLLRTDPDSLLPPARRVTRLLARRGVGAAAAVAVVEGVLIAVFMIRGVMPNVTPLIFTLVCWALLVLIVLIITNRRGLAAWFARSQPFWISTGVMLAGLTALGGLYLLTGLLLDRTGIVDTLRGQSDPRKLRFVDDEIDSGDYWTELSRLGADWLPYTYSRIEPHSGPYINVADNGLRQTASFVSEDAEAVEIFFFGGSTVWGDGARDGYTIPSWAARLLNDEAATPARVTNYGQYAYVSTQDMILFELQLALGRVPDVAVFYQGFNDIAAAYMNDLAGLPHNEDHRLQEFRMGRMLDNGTPVLWRPRVSLDDIDVSLVATSSGSPQDIVEIYLQNARLVRAAAAEYGVQPLFVWQPSLLFKKTRTAEEESYLSENRAKWPGFEDLYRAADEELRRRVAAEGLDDVVILSDLFQDETGYVFFDRVHVMEAGNRTVASALLPFILDRLNMGASANE